MIVSWMFAKLEAAHLSQHSGFSAGRMTCESRFDFHQVETFYLCHKAWKGFGPQQFAV
jgi:hypothetical protein